MIVIVNLDDVAPDVWHHISAVIGVAADLSRRTPAEHAATYDVRRRRRQHDMRRGYRFGCRTMRVR